MRYTLHQKDGETRETHQPDFISLKNGGFWVTFRGFKLYRQKLSSLGPRCSAHKKGGLVNKKIKVNNKKAPQDSVTKPLTYSSAF